jgi:hypothetical protein
MNIIEKNLFDDEKIINGYIKYLDDNNEIIVSVEINQYTKDYLKEKGIYVFKNIPVIINNDLVNNEIKINQEKKIKATEYMPYKVGEDNE